MTQTDAKSPPLDPTGRKRLETALQAHFAGKEAGLMAQLLDAALSVDTIAYESLDLPPETRDDTLLAAFEERALIPVRSSRSAAWEDRVLSLAPGEHYFMPGVVRSLLTSARERGRLDPEGAVRRVISRETATLPAVAEQAGPLAALVTGLRKHASAYRAETGLMKAVARHCGLALDLHDVIDILVICGILSPCTHGPVITGLSWYEINACLYWGRGEAR